MWVTAAPQVMWSTDSVRVFTVDGGWVWNLRGGGTTETPSAWAGRCASVRGGLTDCPRSRDRDRRHAAQRHRRDRRCRPARLPRRLAGRRARHAVRPKASACRSSRLARAGAPSRTRSAARPRAWPSDTLTVGRVRRLARPAAPRPPPPVLAARPGRPRAAPVPRRRLRRPWPLPVAGGSGPAERP